MVDLLSIVEQQSLT